MGMTNQTAFQMDYSIQDCSRQLKWQPYILTCPAANRWAAVDQATQYAAADSLMSCPGQKGFYKGAEKQGDSTENSWLLEIVHGMFTSAFLKHSLRKVSDY